ncbi:MAG: hypothetical protein AABX66_03950 [Nanoarchaeota archaeon]
MADITYGHDGTVIHVKKSFTDRAEGPLSQRKPDYIERLHSRVFALNGSKIRKSSGEIDVSATLDLLTKGVTSMKLPKVERISNLRCYVKSGEMAVYISCKISGTKYDWVPNLPNLPRHVSDALEDIE